MAETYFLPGYAGEISGDSAAKAYEQKSALYNLYSPRLFGAPPQLTSQCDMRLKSSNGDVPGPVGDWYLDNVLRDAQCANFIVGHALFNGGMSSFASLVRSIGQYSTALTKYHVFDNNGNEVSNQSAAAAASMEYSIEAYKKALGEDDGKIQSMKKASELGMSGADDDAYMADVEAIPGSSGILSAISAMFSSTGVLGGIGGLRAAFKDSASMQQAFYTFEADWSSYINNVKMMINAAITMLGLSDAKVRIGDNLVPIAYTAGVKQNDDVWTNYRFITPTENKSVGQINGIDTLLGDTNQYVSFMIEPTGVTETHNNTTTQSTIYSSVINSGNTIGKEIAFLTNTSVNAVDDALINLSGKAINLAENIMQKLTLGTGRFTAAIMGSMARSYTGDHTIFPEIFDTHSSTSSVSISIKLRANAGDPYTYLIDILVPMFHLIAMAIPQMSKNAASAYSYPPLVQVNIPGAWGTRLGIIESLNIEKNPESDFSINGYPLGVNITVNVKDLQHVVMSSGMNQPAMMLNNHTMFDYIAQCAGVDKYRINGAIRIVTRLSLAAAAGADVFHNIGNAILNDGISLVNRITGNANV